MLRILSVLLVLVVALAGCAPASQTPAGDPTVDAMAPTPAATLDPGATVDPAGGTVLTGAEGDITGNISELTMGSADVLVTILVEGEGMAGNEYDRAYVRVIRDTELMELTAAGAVPLAYEDLQVGDTVSVTFVGPVAESFPVQGIAGSVVLLNRAPRQ